MESRRRAELLATLSPEGRATYEVFRAQLARDTDRWFAESKASLKKDLEAVFGDLRPNCSRIPGSDDAERAMEIVAATATAPALSTPAVRHVFPAPVPSSPPAMCGDADFTAATPELGNSATPTATTTTSDDVPELAEYTEIIEVALHSVTPSTCSTICLGADTSVTSTPSLPVAVPTSSMTPGLNLVTSTSTSSTLGLGPVVGAIQDEAHMFMADVFPADSVREELLPPDQGTQPGHLTLYQPWPPPGYVIRCKDMIQALQFDVFVLDNAQLMLCTAKKLWLPSPNSSPCLYCPVAEADLNLNIKQQGQLWCPPNGVVCWKLCANGRPLSEEESSENSFVFLPRDKTQLILWPPPPSMHVFLPAREKNPCLHSWLELLLFEHIYSLEAFSDCHITETCLKYICPTLEAQGQELVTTEKLLGKIQLMRVTLLWQFLRKWKFNGSADYFVQSTSARHVDNHDKCILVLLEMRHMIPASLYFLLYGFIAYTKIHPIVVFGRAVHVQFFWTIACGTVYWSFSYLQNIWLHPLLESEFQFCFAGKALLSGYVAAQIQWEIAWPTTTLSYSSPYVKLNFRGLAWLFVGSYWASSDSGNCGIVTLRELSFWRYQIPLVHQVMLNVYNTFSPGNLILLSTAAANSDMAQYLHCKGPQGTNESDCVASRYLVGVFPPGLLEGQPSACVDILQTPKLYSTRLNSCKGVCNSFVMELGLDHYGSSYLTGHLIQRACEVMQWEIPWSFSSPILGDWFLFYPTRKVCFQFGVKGSLSSQDELYPSITIVKLHGILVEVVELKPWSYWELFTCVSAVTRCLCGASHILPSSVLILTCTSSRSNYYCQVHILDASLTRLSTSVILHAGKCYLLLRLYSSCDQFDSAAATYLGSQFFEWQIPWYIGGNEGLVIQIAVKTTGLRPTKIPCCSLLIQSLVVLAAVLPVGEIGAQFTEPLLLAILSLKRRVQLKPSQFGGVHFLHVQQVVPRRVTVMSMRGNKIFETLSLHANKTNGGGGSLCLVLPDVLLHTILDSWAYEVCFCELKNYWDPGGIELQFSERAFLIWLVMPWDPGGYAWPRLEVKPNFKDGGLSATSPLGRYSLARPALKTQTTTTNTKERPHERLAWKERTDGLGR